MNKLFHLGNEIQLFIDGISDESQTLVCDYITNTYNDSVNLLKYPNKMTLIFKEDNEDIMEFIEELLFLCTSSDEFEEFDVPGLEKPKTEFKGVQVKEIGDRKEKAFQDGPYKGLKPSIALKKYGYISLIEMMKQTPYNNEIKDSIILSIKSFLKEHYKNISPEELFNLPIENVQNFIKLNEVFMSDSIKEILSRAMYKDIETFINNAPEEVLKSAYMKISKDLCNKFYV